MFLGATVFLTYVPVHCTYGGLVGVQGWWVGQNGCLFLDLGLNFALEF